MSFEHKIIKIVLKKQQTTIFFGGRVFLQENLVQRDGVFQHTIYVKGLFWVLSCEFQFCLQSQFSSVQFFGGFSFSSFTRKQMACQQVLELLLNWCCYILGIATNNFYICKVCGITCAKRFARILCVVSLVFLKSLWLQIFVIVYSS